MKRKVDIKKVYGLYLIFAALEFMVFLLSGTQGFQIFGVTVGETEKSAEYFFTAFVIWAFWRTGSFK